MRKETQLVNSNKPGREAKLRVARMEANQSLQREQLRRRKRDNDVALIVMVVALAVATVLALTVFLPKDDGAAVTDAAATDAPTSAGATETAAGGTAPASAGPSTPAESNSPTVPDAATAKDQVFTGTLSLNGKTLDVELDGTRAPQAAAVFKSLADSGFMTGKTCHRLANAPGFGLLQCGSAKGDGQGNPDYQWGPVENSPADGKYPAGTIAVARASSTFSNGTQFFITFEDTTLPQETGGYTIVGKVTGGLDAVTAIAADGIEGGSTDGAPKTKVTIDSFQIN
ncbi:peptidylprolyl isomerase [Specibacter sp. NPDC057265]|uniref:peptidylprolyl isomerase n=1 Tax=Specibacter sp. NPDC057265 TaxID=3346075 RepID=UPI00363CE72A